jgi:hypothetical protein
MDMSVTQDAKIGDLDSDYINNGKGIFSNETTTRLPQAVGGEETRKVVVSDIDNDGDPIYYSAT